MKKILLSILATLGLFGAFFVFADSNGIWHEAADIRGGVFGSDEQEEGILFSFINPVLFNSKVTFKEKVGIKTDDPQAELDVNGTVLANNIRSQSCPPGAFIRGFDENSNIVCEVVYTFEWEVGEWSACSAVCGAGTQSRDVSCIRNDGVTVDDSFCSETKPETSQPCTGTACEPDIYSTPGTYTYTVPNGISSLRVNVYGAGGGPAPNNCYGNKCYYGSGGGGGGGHAESVLAVTSGETYTLIVGAGGGGNAAGGTSSFDSPTLYATGGNPGVAGSDSGGAGGSGYNGNVENRVGGHGGSGATGGDGIYAFGGGGHGYDGYGRGANGEAAAGGYASGQNGAVVISYE